MKQNLAQNSKQPGRVFLWASIECDRPMPINNNRFIEQQTPAYPPAWIAEAKQSWDELQKTLNFPISENNKARIQHGLTRYIDNDFRIHHENNIQEKTL